MAVGSNKIQVTWPTSAVTLSVASASTGTSEVISASATAFKALVTCKADNAGTPASGDYVDFYYSGSTGDPDADADSATEYPTNVANMEWLCRIDSNDTDPDVKTAVIETYAAEGKIIAVNNSAASSTTVSAQIEEKTA